MKLFTAGGGNPIHLPGAELLDGVVSPAFSTNQNDCNYDAIAGGCLLRIRLSAPIAITGLTGGQANRLVLLGNDSAFNLTLPHLSNASLPVNQFNNGGAAIVLQPGGFAYYLYNARTSLWDLLQLNTGGPGGAGSLFVAKPADTNRNNTIIPAADPDLIFPAVPAGTYQLLCYLAWDVNGIGAQFVISSTGAVPVGIFTTLTADNTPTAYAPSTQNTGGVGVPIAAAAAFPVASKVDCMLVQTTPGSISVNWAQLTSNAALVKLRRGSWCQLTKIL